VARIGLGSARSSWQRLILDPSSFMLSVETFPGIERNYWAKTVDPADSLTK
jgi:hypothetical protein